jgi:ankyrin repeat protein
MSTKRSHFVRIITGMLAVGLVFVLAAPCTAGTEDNGHALINAALKGDLQQVQELLDRGADVNAKNKHGETALLWALHERHLDTVKLLLDKGADIGPAEQAAVYLPGVVKTFIDRGAKVTIIVAACVGDGEQVQQLIIQGADVNAKGPDDWSPLMVAARGGHLEVVKLLLDRGADVNAPDMYGQTSLTNAAREGDFEMVKMLLDKGADVNQKPNDSGTALNIAQEKGHSQIVELLKAHGAKE